MSKLSKKERKHAQKIFNDFLMEELRNVNKLISKLDETNSELWERISDLDEDFSNTAKSVFSIQDQNKNQVSMNLSFSNDIQSIKKVIQDITTKDMQKSIDKLTSKRGRPKKVPK